MHEYNEALYSFEEALTDLVDGWWRVHFYIYCQHVMSLPPIILPCSKTERFLKDTLDLIDDGGLGEDIFKQVSIVILIISEAWEDVYRNRHLNWIDALSGDISLVIRKIRSGFGLTQTLLESIYDLEVILLTQVHSEIDYVELALKCLELAEKLNQYGANFLFLDDLHIR